MQNRIIDDMCIKKWQSNDPFITVVTVVFNDANGLPKTIESIVRQTYSNIEYIIIDGGSTDGTVDVIKQYESKITFWVSKPDDGIYDAMNKGINLSTGQWVNFMNAGDTFANNKVLDDINLSLYSNYALVYGNALLNNKTIKYPSNIEQGLRDGIMMACHQAMFFNKNILKGNLKYNTNYKIAGDYDLNIRIFVDYQNLLKYVNITVVIFQADGISSIDRNSLKIGIEAKKIQQNNFGSYSKKLGIIYLNPQNNTKTFTHKHRTLLFFILKVV